MTQKSLRRIAVKIGSNVLTRKDGTLDITRMSSIVDQVAELHRRGMEIILISSGAVASGRSELRLSQSLDSVSARQLYSAKQSSSTVTMSCFATTALRADRFSPQRRISPHVVTISIRSTAWM